MDSSNQQQTAPRLRHANGSRPSTNQPSQKTSQNWTANTRPPCPFDGQTHQPAYCSIYQNSPLEEKKRLVSEKKLCFKCLGQHQVKYCPSKHTANAISIITQLYTTNYEHKEHQRLIQTSDRIKSTILPAERRYQESKTHCCYIYQ